MTTSSVMASPTRTEPADRSEPVLGLPAQRAVRRHLADHLGDVTGRRVLDAGCGTGEDALELSALVGPAGKVIGIDVGAELVAACREQGAGSGLAVEFRHGDPHEMDFPDGHFDAVRAKELLSRCSRPDDAASELLRVTKPGGRMAVFEYDLDTVTVDHPDTATTRRILHFCSDGPPHRWSGRQLARRLMDLGVDRVTVTPHTTLMPPANFRGWLRDRIRQAEEHGRPCAVTESELDEWWRPLTDAARRGRFFASITGFTLGTTA